MNALAERVARRTAALLDRDGPIVVAVSGGADSVALLDLLWLGRAAHGRHLVIGHIDHGIAAGSAAVAEMVRTLAHERELPFRGARLELGDAASETRARTARRRALRAIAHETGGAAIALAHHAHDQQETVLLRVLRGSGPAGLAGMSPRRGVWIRPLLETDPARLREHLETRGIRWWEDPANADPRHLRSWVRTTLFPVLEPRLPGVRAALEEVAGQAAEQRAVLNLLPGLLPELDFRSDSEGISVAAGPLSGYRSAVQRGVLSALGRRLGVPISRSRLARLQELLGASGGGIINLGPRLEAELTFGRLLMRRPLASWEATPLPRNGTTSAGRFGVRVTPGVAGELRRDGWRSHFPESAVFTVRPWRQGDRIRPLGGSGSRLVADLLAEHRVSRGMRAGWPVVTAADATIVWVPGICRSEAAHPVVGEEALDVEFELDGDAAPHRRA